MRLSVSSPHLRTLFVVPFFAAMLALPALAEPNPGTPPDAPAASNALPESEDAATPEAGTSAETDVKPEGGANAATGEVEPESGESGANAATDEAKPDDADPDADAAAIEAPKSSVVINIDKSTQEMTVFKDGVELYAWPVSTGTRGYSTPSGSYTASSMNEIWYSKQWDNAPMPHAIFFTKKGHAIHGTLEERNLGNAASHGCVRLSRANAKTLFHLVKETGLENTQVVLTGVTRPFRRGSRGPLDSMSSPARSRSAAACSAGAGSSRKRKGTTIAAVTSRRARAPSRNS